MIVLITPIQPETLALFLMNWFIAVMVVPIEGKHSLSGPYGDHSTPGHCHYDFLGHVHLDASLFRDKVATSHIPHLLLQLPSNSCQVLALKVSYCGALLLTVRSVDDHRSYLNLQH